MCIYISSYILQYYNSLESLNYGGLSQTKNPIKYSDVQALFIFSINAEPLIFHQMTQVMVSKAKFNIIWCPSNRKVLPLLKHKSQ